MNMMNHIAKNGPQKLQKPHRHCRGSITFINSYLTRSTSWKLPLVLVFLHIYLGDSLVLQNHNVSQPVYKPKPSVSATRFLPPPPAPHSSTHNSHNHNSSFSAFTKNTGDAYNTNNANIKTHPQNYHNRLITLIKEDELSVLLEGYHKKKSFVMDSDMDLALARMVIILLNQLTMLAM